MADRFTPVRVAYEAKVDGQRRYVEVTLSPGAQVGLPLPGDHLVLLALLQDLMGSLDARGKMAFATKIAFERLGWGDGGRNYGMLKQALDRLVQATISVGRTWVARNGRPYKQVDAAMHLVDSYHLSTDAGDTSWVEWGRVVREAFELGDLKRLDWGLVKSLSSSSAVQLYRFIDRAVLSGETRLEVDWTTLATAIGMSTGYDRPAKFKAKIQGYLDQLIDRGYLDRVDYGRGGTFVFHLPNYLRAQLRRLLVERSVYPEAARQIVAGYDEVRILQQIDCLPFRQAREQGAYLVEAIRQGYPLQYPDGEVDSFQGMWNLLFGTERDAYHQGALRLVGPSLFDSQTDPREWSPEFRAVVRGLLTCNLDPELV